MQFVENQILYTDPPPIRITPCKKCWVHDSGWPMNAAGLATGGRIRKRPLSIDLITVQVARLYFGGGGVEVPGGGFFERNAQRPARRRLNHQFDPAGLRRPEAKLRRTVLAPSTDGWMPVHCICVSLSRFLNEAAGGNEKITDERIECLRAFALARLVSSPAAPPASGLRVDRCVRPIGSPGNTVPRPYPPPAPSIPVVASGAR